MQWYSQTGATSNVPRKYRPPTTKRRKARKATIPYEFERPEETTIESNGASEDNPLVAVDVAEAPPEPDEIALPRGTTRAERHVARDYSYVRGEIVRIALIAVFLIIALIITGILRN
jgi:hypothetical protein